MARIMTITRSGMTPEAIEELISRRVEEALAAQEVNCNAGLLDEKQSQNRDDNDNESGGNRDHGNNNGDGNQNGGNEGARRNAPIARVCTYNDFLNCQPCNFSGTKGVVGLARWFEKIESVFHISNYASNSQVKFDTCTLLDGALTWCNSHVQTIGIDEAYEISWKDLMKLMIEELTLLCPRMVPEENDKIERFIWGFPDNIQGNVNSSKPVRLQDAIRMANGLMDQKVHVQNVAYAVTVGNIKKKGYARSALTVVAVQTPRKSPRGKPESSLCDYYLIGVSGSFQKGGNGNPDSNVVTSMFLLNNHYAYILFDSGADRSFVLTTFSALIDIPSTALDVSYIVELADGRIPNPTPLLGVFEAIEAAKISVKKTEDKSEEKRIEDVSIVRDFLEVFP
ncbi:hypothetical protein Tco_1416874 [Tanacetum coccineum]